MTGRSRRYDARSALGRTAHRNHSSRYRLDAATAMLGAMGTDAWRNWKAYNDGRPEIENVDEELHSDRRIVGGPTSLGPYTLSIIIRAERSDLSLRVGPAVRLHLGVHEHLIPDVVVDGELVKANSDAYHGGTASDEVAALISLDLGVRLRVAGIAQMSLIHEGNETGTPISLEVPTLAHPGRRGREFVPAARTRTADLSNLHRVDSFPRIDEKAQVELVRAARAYATGLWWANEDPNLAWLQLVTAVEIGANFRQDSTAEPTTLVEQLWPELWSALEPADEPIRVDVAKLLAPQIRAARKFVDFLVSLAPEPPEVRPPFGELAWDSLKEHARLIYGHRSRALHAGKPFPLPMLEEPRTEENGATQEVPYGLNSGGLGGVWDAKEAPMLLSTFEYLARGSLLAWWDELISPPQV